MSRAARSRWFRPLLGGILALSLLTAPALGFDPGAAPPRWDGTPQMPAHWRHPSGGAQPITAAVAAQRAAEAQALQSALDRARGVARAYGVTFSVVRDGTSWSGATGVARDGTTRLRADTPFVIGSVTKTFVTAAMLGLAEEGRLSLDDAVTAWLPGLRVANGVTIRELLAHTSGIADLYPPLQKQLVDEPQHGTTTSPPSPTRSRRAFWANADAYAVSLLKAWWGDAATKENNWAYDYLPRLTGAHGTYQTTMAMKDGEVEGYFLLGQNPAVGSAHGRMQRLALAELKWLVVRDLNMIESATFWKDAPEIATGELETETTGTGRAFTTWARTTTLAMARTMARITTPTTTAAARAMTTARTTTSTTTAAAPAMMIPRTTTPTTTAVATATMTAAVITEQSADGEHDACILGW